MTDHKLIFVGGLHRSGTSLLHRCISDHPQVSGFSGTDANKDEGQHLQSVFPPAYPFGGPGKFGFNPKAHFDESSVLVSEENARQLFDEWSAYWDLQKPVLVEKSPPTLTRARFLQALFPEAYFVFILRHPVAVAFATRKWSGTSIHSLIQHWLICHERFEQDRPHLKRQLVVRYEDLVEAPEPVMNRIWEFVGLEAFGPERTVRQGINEEYFGQWRALARRDPIRKAYVAFTRWRFASRVQRFGYSLKV